MFYKIEIGKKIGKKSVKNIKKVMKVSENNAQFRVKLGKKHKKMHEIE